MNAKSVKVIMMLVKVDEKDRKAIVELSKKLYSKEAVESAAKAFSSFEIKVDEGKDYYKISIKSSSMPIKRVALEFCNYVLAEMKTLP